MTREEALQAIKEKMDYYESDKRLRGAIETLVPELRESEDERIIRAIIDALYSHTNSINLLSSRGYQMEDIEAWLEKQKPSFRQIHDSVIWDNGLRTGMELEKQKEQEPIKWTDLTWKDIVELEGIINNVHYDFSAGIGQESFGKEVLERFRSTKGMEYLDEAEQKYWREEGQKEQKHTLKFKVGDKVHLEGDDVNILTITGIEKDRYLTDCAYGPILFGSEDIWEIVEQKPAEKPDLVAELKHHLATTPKEQLEAKWKELEKWNHVGPTVEEYLCGIKPAEWSEEDKHNLSSVINLVHATTDGAWGSCIGDRIENWLKNLPERFNLQPKQEWSKEDREALDMCLDAIPKRWETKSGILLTKWLKDNIHLQSKQEWSEEDEKMRENIISDLRYFRDCETDEDSVSDYDDEINWLKDIFLNHKKFIEAVDKLCSNEWSEEDN